MIGLCGCSTQRLFWLLNSAAATQLFSMLRALQSASYEPLPHVTSLSLAIGPRLGIESCAGCIEHRRSLAGLNAVIQSRPTPLEKLWRSGHVRLVLKPPDKPAKAVLL